MRRKTDSPTLPLDQRTGPDLALETAAQARGARLVAGIDEAGRGPWAGPVAVAAVILDPTCMPDGLDDSKRLTAARREDLADLILARHDVCVVMASPARIDATDIRKATLWAMARAASGLAQAPDAALIDGRDVPPGLPCAGRAVVGGDGLSLSIAAASIVAKTLRDRLMDRLALAHPGYGFESHKGYGTRQHQDALTRLGPCPIHRMTFRPIRDLLPQ